MVYGKTKIGKTLDVNYTFGKNGYVILSEPDGLASVEANLGFMPPHFELTSLKNPAGEVMDHLNKVVLPDVKQGRIKAVIFDSGSEFADRLLSSEMDKCGNDMRRAYQPMYRQFGTIVRHILLSGAWVIMICHEKRGDPDEDRRGGPLLPGRLVESVPSQFSLILRAVARKGERIYLCDQLDEDWIMGDRYGAAFEEQPMELRAIMWRIAHPDKDTPAEYLLGKPIRRGGKVYAPGMLPQRAAAKNVLDDDEGSSDTAEKGVPARGDVPAVDLSVFETDMLVEEPAASQASGEEAPPPVKVGGKSPAGDSLLS